VDTSAALASQSRRVFGKEPLNRHAEPLLLAQLAYNSVLTLPKPEHCEMSQIEEEPMWDVSSALSRVEAAVAEAEGAQVLAGIQHSFVVVSIVLQMELP
jgi:hypothetical protein